MDFTELPENWAAVLALALNLENLGEIGLFTDTLNHMLQKLRLGKRVFVIHGEVIQELLFLRAAFLALEEAEASHNIVLTFVGLIRDAFVSVSEFLEDTGWQLETTEVGSSENSADHWIAHPLFAKNGT